MIPLTALGSRFVLIPVAVAINEQQEQVTMGLSETISPMTSARMY